MGRPAARRGHAVVRDRGQQALREPDERPVDLDQPGLLGAIEGVGRFAELLERGPHDGGAPGVVGGDDGERPARDRVERVETGRVPARRARAAASGAARAARDPSARRR